ncbi:MAG: GTP-binding protein Era [Candidatus Phytoplasma pruni]|uniref:GTPase Era n=1 Tax=Poinsettia branch-inducing phytoplasma TaxID=138647 RepID=UPI0003771C77|nr:GTPase Era [Poinsettia branch-inducing phytoplasma]WEK82238.1 MAG: GTP-binding protein Era [Candidatus Phytoplasma pruni]
MFKSGFITMIGNTNVGKSTLLNSLIKQKISITSSKSQTTRNKIMGIINDPHYQLIFVDTPGIHKEKYLLNNNMNSLAIQSIKDVDIVLFVVDRECTFKEEKILQTIQQHNKKVILVINKIDEIKQKILIDKIIFSYLEKFPFEHIIPLSAMTQQNVDILQDKILSLTEEGPLYFDNTMVTNVTEQEMISELVREKILYYVHEEVPHACAVTVEDMRSMEENPSLLEISVLILVEKPSQKKILIGAKGEKIKRIGTEARKDINRTLNKRIHLNVWIKVEKNWRNRINLLKQLGYMH